MKIFKAEPVIVPNDLAERLDVATGQEKGYLRNLIADGGNLQELEEELLAIGLMSKVKGVLEDKNLPDECKALSIERLSNVIYVIMFAYCTGTMHVLDDGDTTFGEGLDDMQKAIEVAKSDKIKFANGKTMHTVNFMRLLKSMSSPESVDSIYNRVVTRQGLVRGVSPQAAFNVAKVSILAAKDLMK